MVSKTLKVEEVISMMSGVLRMAAMRKLQQGKNPLCTLRVSENIWNIY